MNLFYSGQQRFPNIFYKLVFLLGQPFQPSLMFVSKARAYPSGAPFRWSILVQSRGLSHKHYSRLKAKACLGQTLP